MHNINILFTDIDYGFMIMTNQQSEIDRYIKNMLEGITNKVHKQTIQEYLFIRKRIDKVNKYTRRNDMQSLLALHKFLIDKPFQNATQDDLIRFEEYLENEYRGKNGMMGYTGKKGLSKSTIEQYEAHIKRFYKYLSNPKEYKKGKRFQKNIPYPDSVNWISTNNGTVKELPIDNLLDEKQILLLLDTCESLRDQAMFGAGFYDAGLRNSELISLNVNSVGFDKLGGYFILPKKGKDQKTGMRKIRLFIMQSSTKYLKDFLNNHPFKHIEYAPLFYSVDKRVYSRIVKKVKEGKATRNDIEQLRFSRTGIEGKLRQYCKIAELPKLTPHTLRHNSCTLSAKAGFNEMELRIRYGWSPTSKMPSRYTHLASKDLDDKIKIITGFVEPEEKPPSDLEVVLCWNCKEENIPTNKFCSRCGSKLNKDKDDITPTATDVGLLMQKGIPKESLEQMMKETLIKMLQEDDDMLKKYLKK